MYVIINLQSEKDGRKVIIMKTDDRKNKIFSLRIDTELKEQFFKLCYSEDRSPSRVLKSFMVEYIEKNKGKLKKG